MSVTLTVDVEQDCPPYLDTWRGITEGLPRLLALLREAGVPATCFVTGETARRYPDAVASILDDGHELGCHGDLHRRFDRMSRDEAAAEIETSTRTLRPFAEVTAFRAPYLRFPDPYVGVLEAAGYRLDSSQARYKWPRGRLTAVGRVTRVPASITSSALRLPAALRNRLLARLRPPVVLFVHPWEFVDLGDLPLRFDCRVRTGDAALASLAGTIRYFTQHGARFRLLSKAV